MSNFDNKVPLLVQPQQYDCTIGGFLSLDPLMDKFPDMSPYSYANNNPISFKDPTGLEPEGEKGKDEVQVYQGMSPDDWNSYLLKACSEINSMSFLEDQMARDFRRNLFYSLTDQHFGNGGGGGGNGSSSGVNGKRTGTNSDNGTNTESTEKSTFEKVVDAFNVAIDFIGSILYDNTIGLIPGLSNNDKTNHSCNGGCDDCTPIEIPTFSSIQSPFIPAFIGVSVGSSSYVGFGTGTSLDIYFQLKGNGAGSFYLTMTQQLGLGYSISPIYLSGNIITHLGDYNTLNGGLLETSIEKGLFGVYLNSGNHSIFGSYEKRSNFIIQYSYSWAPVEQILPGPRAFNFGVYNTFLIR